MHIYILTSHELVGDNAVCELCLSSRLAAQTQLKFPVPFFGARDLERGRERVLLYIH